MLLVAGCAGADVGGPDDGAAADAADESTDDEVEGDADDGVEDPADAAPATEGGATVTIDGVAYEATQVLDCSTGEAEHPDDRLFVGTSADGAVHIDISYFADEGLAGLNGVTVELVDAGADGGDLTWATSYAGGGIEVQPRPDGADGSAQVRSLNRPDGEADAEVTWTFTC